MNQENLNLNEKRQLTEANAEVTQMLKLSHKYFTAAVIKTLQQEILNMFETNEKYKVLAKK